MATRAAPHSELQINEVLDQALITVISTSTYFADQFNEKHREFLRKENFISDVIRSTHTITDRVWAQRTYLRFWSFEKSLLSSLNGSPALQPRSPLLK